MPFFSWVISPQSQNYFDVSRELPKVLPHRGPYIKEPYDKYLTSRLQSQLEVTPPILALGTP